ncbi:hypothetical protein IAI10_19595 [Clostridium sp. 19966]|uniref:glycosyl hydrolase family 8 n=1 Tax=Clostridium sp. 19966 TaxID=2768166 RepID=UPI0028E028E5|nr:glycosyl hydrolase family 8 [Clostridium sp. 19966]MDT8718862.1 hypothetical protein [Clostridium sp. 19966]
MKRKAYKLVVLFIMLIIIAAAIFQALKSKTDVKDKTYTDNYYEYWKKNFVEDTAENMSRVVDPQRNNITVSEGMGYGMLFASAMGDYNLFQKLWNYTEKYLDDNGLMNWQIAASGKIIGEGSASDADEDIAYSLLLAAKKWNNSDYDNAAKAMVEAVKKNDISSEYVLLPGDKWGSNRPFNPSYAAPLYYLDFQKLQGQDKSFWQKIIKANMDLLEKNMDKNTGFLPDWINEDGTIEQKDNIYGYEALRVPLRLISFYEASKDSGTKDILQRQEEFLKSIGIDKLTAEYSRDGKARQNYINTSYLASYAASSLINYEASFSKQLIDKLKASDDKSYYGSSLKLWTFLIISGKIK